MTAVAETAGAPVPASTERRAVWLRAGQALLRSGGIGAVKIHALGAESGLTTGSFYHHFGGMTEFLDELAAFWGGDTPAHLEEAAHDDPRERLHRLAKIAARHDLAELDAAMRDWAGAGGPAAASVERVDKTLLTFVADAFRDLGFDVRDARFRAQLWLCAGVARISPPWKPIHGSDHLIDILTATREAAGRPDSTT